jgi:hypothetical protein
MKRRSQFGWSVLIPTEATSGEAVEQAKAPITFPIRADLHVFGILVATCLHRSSALAKHMVLVCMIDCSCSLRNAPEAGY